MTPALAQTVALEGRLHCAVCGRSLDDAACADPMGCVHRALLFVELVARRDGAPFAVKRWLEERRLESEDLRDAE